MDGPWLVDPPWQTGLFLSRLKDIVVICYLGSLQTQIALFILSFHGEPWYMVDLNHSRHVYWGSDGSQAMGSGNSLNIVTCCSLHFTCHRWVCQRLAEQGRFTRTAQIVWEGHGLWRVGSWVPDDTMGCHRWQLCLTCHGNCRERDRARSMHRVQADLQTDGCCPVRTMRSLICSQFPKL